MAAEPVLGAGIPLLFWFIFATLAALDMFPKPGGGWSGGFGPATWAARELFANSGFSSGSHLCPRSRLLWLLKAAVSPTDDTMSSGLIALAVLSSSTSIAASPRGVSTIALFERLTLRSMSGHWEIICPRHPQCPHLSVLVGLEEKPEKLRSIFSFRMSSPVSGFLMTSSSFFPVLALNTGRVNFPGNGCACSSRRCCEKCSIASFWR